MTTDGVSDDRLREIAAAAEALHREEWGFVDSDEDTRILIVRAPNDAIVAASEDYKRASFIADCQPATVAALASELLALREAAQKVYAGLNARIDAAPANAVPLFDGIAELHDAINFGGSDV